MSALFKTAVLSFVALACCPAGSVRAQASAPPQVRPPVPAAAACSIEAVILEGKRKVPSQNCFENVDAEPDDFARVCEAMSNTALAVTQAAGTPPPKVVHGKSCPAGAVATCKGFLHLNIINHHYRISGHELELARESCLTQNGVWK